MIVVVVSVGVESERKARRQAESESPWHAKLARGFPRSLILRKKIAGKPSYISVLEKGHMR